MYRRASVPFLFIRKRQQKRRQTAIEAILLLLEVSFFLLRYETLKTMQDSYILLSYLERSIVCGCLLFVCNLIITSWSFISKLQERIMNTLFSFIFFYSLVGWSWQELNRIVLGRLVWLLKRATFVAQPVTYRLGHESCWLNFRTWTSVFAVYECLVPCYSVVSEYHDRNSSVVCVRTGSNATV